MLAMALSPWVVKKRQWRARQRLSELSQKKKSRHICFGLVRKVRNERCRDHLQKHYHGELCGRCGAIFTINRPWSLPELKTHHGVEHGTSSTVLEKRLARSEST